MIITELDDNDRRAWDAYVRNSELGLPHHLSGWCDVLKRTYGHETCYLMAQEGGQVVGVLPLFIVRSILVGISATTMPGGLCTASPEIATALIARGKEIAQKAGASCLVIQDSREEWPGELNTASNHVSWVVEVNADTDALWKGLHKNVRRQVRMAHKNGLTAEVDRTGDRVDDFYEVLSRFTHQTGTPFFGKAFVENIVEVFPGGFTIALVYSGEEPVGAYFSLVMGNRSWGTWGGTLHEYLQQRAVYLAYWEVLRDAAENGYRFVDMGRSEVESGRSKFKSQWGGVPAPIYQQVAVVDGHQTDASIVERVKSDGKFQLMMRLWPKLPLPVAQFLGPWLRRHVPFA
jgi:FemAB-related protein (PEP-CTERM system-associated)